MAAMTTRAIMDLISNPPSGIKRGALAHMARRDGSGADALTHSQRAFVKDYADIPTPAPVQASAHPGQRPPYRKPGPLTQAEHAWLARIPSPVDPKTVPFEDARALASMVDSIDHSKHPDEARLVHSVWAPIRDFHDHRAADAALTNAQTELAPIPASTLGALADAIWLENGQLTPEEAAGRASAMISEAKAKRDSARTAAIEAAKTEKATIAAKVHDRTVVTPPAGPPASPASWGRGSR